MPNRYQYSKQLKTQDNPIVRLQNVKYPEILRDSSDTYVYTTRGDRYDTLAQTYYGDSEYWWIIAWFNKKPTEQHIELGETILVPLFLDELLSIIGL